MKMFTNHNFGLKEKQNKCLKLLDLNLLSGS